MSLVMECHFAGCDAKIDVIAELEEMARDICVDDKKRQRGELRIPWLTHTVTCPKCGNCVGSFDVGPGTFGDFDGERNYVSKPRAKGRRRGMVAVGHKRKDLNKHLKRWARWNREPLDRDAWVVEMEDGPVVVTSEWMLRELKSSKKYVRHRKAVLKRSWN